MCPDGNPGVSGASAGNSAEGLFVDGAAEDGCIAVSVCEFGDYLTEVRLVHVKQTDKWMVALYVAMGWTLLFILPAMLRSIPARGMWFILAGGLSYTIGVIFYLWRRMKFSHAVWHLFVIGGSVCFFFAVLFGCILDL